MQPALGTHGVEDARICQLPEQDVVNRPVHCSGRTIASNKAVA